MWLYYVHTCGKLCYSKNVKSIVSFSAWIFLAKCAYIITWFQEITEILTKKYLSFLLRIWDSLGAAILVCSLSAKGRRSASWRVWYFCHTFRSCSWRHLTDTDHWAQNGSTHNRVSATFKRRFLTIRSYYIAIREIMTRMTRTKIRSLLLCSKYSLGLLDQILVSRLGLPRMPISCTIRSFLFFLLTIVWRV